ncbi:MAG: putative CRISPR-associated protein [Candidatus Hadarchaeales archaeon]
MTINAHIVTTGTSTLTNARKEMGKEPTEEELLSFVKRDPRRASAELNTLLPLLEERKDMQHYVYLLHSDTEEGRLCARVLQSFLSQLKLRICAKSVEIAGLGDPKKFRNGLANLLEKVVRLIKSHYLQKDMVYVHATGGFKPETAIALLASNLPGVGAPVLYIHESFREVVRLPAMPVWLRGKEKFRKLMDRMCRSRKVHQLQLEREFMKETVSEAERLGWIERRGDELEITPMGHLLWERFVHLGLYGPKKRTRHRKVKNDSAKNATV